MLLKQTMTDILLDKHPLKTCQFKQNYNLKKVKAIYNSVRQSQLTSDNF